MTEFSASDSDNRKEPKLPKRDLWILPLLGIATIILSLAVAEVAARSLFVVGQSSDCVADDESVGWRYRHNCTAAEKSPEGPWVTREYNDCGYRTKESCGAKPNGTTRLAILGSSIGEGVFVPYDEQFSTRVGNQLTKALEKPVEVQNLSRVACYPLCVFRMVDEALALKPDLLVLVIGPFDLEHVWPEDVANRYKSFGPQKPLADPHDLKAMANNQNVVLQLKMLLLGSRAAYAAQHYLLQNTSIYAQLFLRYGDRADYLRKPFSPAWENRLDTFEVLFDEMAHKSAASHVPFVLVELPSLAQAAVLKMSSVPAGVDPYALSERLRQIAERQGVQFIDSLDLFKAQPNIGKLYYVVDTHPDGDGHALIAQTLAEQLLKQHRAALMGHVEMKVPNIGAR